MKPRSLGYRTDLGFIAFDGEITDRGSYLSIRTPANPSFYWGNFLLFSSPPAEGDFETWRGLFAREIGTAPQFTHQAFGWDSIDHEPGSIQPFLEYGFRLQHNIVLTTLQTQCPRQPAPGVEIRRLHSADEWQQVVENQVRCREAGFSEAPYRLFSQRQMTRYQAMTAAGRGSWYGAFQGVRLVADLGLFHDGQVGRYQAVQTLPDFRRQGLAGALIHAAAEDAFTRLGLETLVIVSEADTPAQRVYEAAGFRVTEHQLGLIKRD